MLGNIWRTAGRIILFVVILFTANFGAMFFMGLLTGISANATTNVVFSGMDKVSFDPLITIAYFLVYYFLTLFFQPNTQHQYYLFLLTLFISFTVNFVQGSFLLICLFWLLRKARFI
jgi:hypothetical protein